MRIISIFEKVKERLYAVRFEAEDRILDQTNADSEQDELEKALGSWKDVIWLREFFMKYRADLQKYEPTIKVGEAVRITIEDAENLYDRLIEASINTSDIELHELFKPLDNREIEKPRYEFQKLKARGRRRKSWIRFYAVKYGGSYVITGGAIKLTDQMKGRPHLQLELNKLEAVRKFLEEEGNGGSFVYLDIA
jgi:hypothetical protein